MPATTTVPELFVIEAAAPKPEDPENQNYEIRLQLRGTYEVRSFLSDSGVSDRRVAFAIEELSRTGQVTVKNQP